MGACTHPKATPLFRVGDAVMWAGSKDDIAATVDRYSVVLSLAGKTSTATVKNAATPIRILRGTGRFAATREALGANQPEIVEIDWPDRSVPPFDPSDWDAIVADLESLGACDVGMCCFGGHGRTGTALVLLGHYAGVWDDQGIGDPVTWVRENYCQKAVESGDQIRYLEDAGVQTQAKGSDQVGKQGGATFTPPAKGQARVTTQATHDEDEDEEDMVQCDWCTKVVPMEDTVDVPGSGRFNRVCESCKGRYFDGLGPTR
jgi:protein-tyrosine phosphatase